MRDAATSPARKPSRHSTAVDRVEVPGRGTVLAFDFGEKRVGVATGECETRLAYSLPGISAERGEARFTAIEKLLAEWRPERLVVGLPLATDGSSHSMTLRARRFARQLEGRFRIPVILVDERYSSVEAESLRRGAPHAGAITARHGVDSAAAQLILQQYFDRPDPPAR